LRDGMRATLIKPSGDRKTGGTSGLMTWRPLTPGTQLALAAHIRSPGNYHEAVGELASAVTRERPQCGESVRALVRWLILSG